MIYYLIAAAAVLLDRAVKHITVVNMEAGDTMPVVENMFHITYVRNTGAAFSMWEEQWVVLILLPLAVLTAGIVLIFLKRRIWSRPMLTSLSLICGGGIGNLIDRISRGYVVDMFDFRIFPVFNVADIMICAGCGLLLLEILVLERKRSRNDA